MLKARLAMGSALVLILGLILTADTYGPSWSPGWMLLCLLGSTAGAVELTAMLQATGLRPSRLTAHLGTATVVLSIFLGRAAALSTEETAFISTKASPPDPLPLLAWPMTALALVILATFLRLSLCFRSRETGATVADLAGTVFVVGYLGGLGSFVAAIRWLDQPQAGWLPLLLLVVASKGSDTGAYTFGRLAGRRKLWPSLSPNKAVEGAVGGLAVGLGLTLLTAGPLASALGWTTLTIIEATTFGVVVSIFAQLGDLMESMLKRDCLTKDASKVLPGFGGVLDVLDSTLFAAPVAFLTLRFFLIS